jgi:hypothetical protein
MVRRRGVASFGRRGDLPPTNYYDVTSWRGKNAEILKFAEAS